MTPVASVLAGLAAAFCNLLDAVMGRRALRKIDPLLDLSHHLVALEELACPLDPAQIFERVAPLEVEIGSGKGLFLYNAAVADPQRDFLGVEVSRKYARFTAARLARHNIPNAVAVQGDGLRFCRDFLADASVAAIHVYFPDPWWKARHKKRRVLNEAFLADVFRLLAFDGRLHFWTDVEEYYETTVALIDKCSPLVGPLPAREKPAEHSLDYRTHFERRTRLANEKVYRSEFVKSEEPETVVDAELISSRLR